MIKVTFLGTSGSTPTKGRGMPSVAITYDGRVYLFDCGEGTQMRMLEYGINISKTDAIFISHVHGDHIIGIAGLLRTLALNRREKPLSIYVPVGYEREVRSLVTFDRAMIGYPVVVKGIRAGIAMSSDGFSVTAFRLSHQISTYGYVFKELDKRRFMKEKAQRLGIKRTMFSELQKKKSIRINNRLVTLGSVTYLRIGKKVVYATDTRPTSTTVKFSKNADLLIHEASYAFSEKKLAVERKHCTAYEAALVARKAGVKRLVLTHVSARYKSPKPLLAEARSVFKNTSIASDGENIFV